MNKLTSSIILAGMALALSTIGASAAVVIAHPGTVNNPSNGIRHEPCDTMGHMRRVSADDIYAIAPWQQVSLISVCEDMDVDPAFYGSLFINGNVDTLRQPIARSQALMQALLARGYDQNDVVNLRYGANDSIILYVHQRAMR